MTVAWRVIITRVLKFRGILLVALLITFPASGLAVDLPPSRLLLISRTQDELQLFLPQDTRLLRDPVKIEEFLQELDGTPPDWSEIHGNSEDPDPDRLFELNRERDRLRAGLPALSQRITFLWEGLLSGYLPDQRGFLVAVGPEMIDTTWGMVRFKAETLPTEFIAVPVPRVSTFLQKTLTRGDNVTVVVAMTGRVVPDEALIYDFAHEDRSQGMIMPMVRVERIDYFLPLP